MESKTPTMMNLTFSQASDSMFSAIADFLNWMEGQERVSIVPLAEIQCCVWDLGSILSPIFWGACPWCLCFSQILRGNSTPTIPHKLIHLQRSKFPHGRCSDASTESGRKESTGNDTATSTNWAMAVGGTGGLGGVSSVWKVCLYLSLRSGESLWCSAALGVATPQGAEGAARSRRLLLPTEWGWNESRVMV